jgi:undecaprenyl diphosphate synthase
MNTHNPRAEPHLHLPDVPREKIPRHIAIIMDGNGRWAQERGFPRIFGHRNGAAAVRTAIETCLRLGVEVLTVYSFSLENWKRPPDEVRALMDLCVTYLDGEADHLKREGVRVRTIGRREGLPQGVLDAIDRITQATSECRAMTLCIAINYGSRAEIADAARLLALDASAGKIDASEIDENALERRLGTAGLPDPDLLIRTAGEFRISNYLLWQISYSEIYVTDTYWPDFDAGEMHKAIRAFAKRSRRFGGLDSSPA